jgi:hypothetical protein
MTKWIKALWALTLTGMFLWASGIIPAIIPEAVPTANKEGNGTKFMLFTGADPATDDCAKFDANHNLVGNGSACGTGGGGSSITSGTFAALPATPCTSGNMYQFTDSPWMNALCVATAWTFFDARFGAAVQFPCAAVGGAWVNQGSATIDCTNGPAYIASPADAADSIKYFSVAVPAATWTVQARIWPQGVGLSDTIGNTLASTGVCVSESQASNTKIYALTLFWDQGTKGLFLWANIQKATNATTPGPPIGAFFVPWTQENETAFKIQQDSTNITFTLLQGNRTPITILQEAKGTFMTTGGNFFGPCVNPRNGTYGTSEWIMHWGATTP